MNTTLRSLFRRLGPARWGFLLAAVLLLLLTGCGVEETVYLPTPLAVTQSNRLPAFGSTAAVSETPEPVIDATIVALSTQSARILTATKEIPPTVTLFPSPTAIPTSTTIPTSIPLPTNTPAPTSRLQGWGPWGLVSSREGLWAFRERDNKMVLLTNDPIYGLYVSPSGRMLAYVTHPNPFVNLEQQPYGYTLKLMLPYTGEVRTITALDPPGIAVAQGGNISPADLEIAYQSMSALYNGGVDWSPGENYIAFASAHEGSSAEVYTYQVSTETIQRLTTSDAPDGPAHAYRLSFSPSGQRIYFARAYNFGTGAGYFMAGAWVVDLKGTVMQVAQGDSMGESLITWVNNELPLLSSTRNDCGEQNLRTVNLVSGQVQIMWPGCIDDRSYSRTYGEVIISVAADTAALQPGNLEGVHRIRLWDGLLTTITSHGFERLYNGQGGYNWFGYNKWEGLFGLDRAGRVTPLFTGTPYDTGTISPLRAAGGPNSWLWSANAILLAENVNGTAQEPQLVLPLDVRGMTASQTQAGVYYFIADEGLGERVYRVSTSEWLPQVVDERITTPRGISWIP